MNNAKETKPKTNRNAYKLFQAHPAFNDGKPRITGMGATTEENAIKRCRTLGNTCGGVWTYEKA